MRTRTIHASDEATGSHAWPQHFVIDWQAAKDAHALYRTLEDREDTIRAGRRDGDMPEARALVVQAYELWQALERVFADSYAAWAVSAREERMERDAEERGRMSCEQSPERQGGYDNPTDDGRDWEGEALALQEARRDAEVDPFDR
jgi:hypothetical protein